MPLTCREVGVGVGTGRGAPGACREVGVVILVPQLTLGCGNANFVNKISVCRTLHLPLITKWGWPGI